MKARRALGGDALRESWRSLRQRFHVIGREFVRELRRLNHVDNADSVSGRDSRRDTARQIKARIARGYDGPGSCC